jgi:hypothetical protein
MNNRDYGVWLIPILAALAVYFPMYSGSPPESSVSARIAAPAPQGMGAKEKNGTQGSGEILLRQFLCADLAAQSDCGAARDVRILLATVSDPMDSGLAHLFDRQVAAIQRALERAGYVLDRFTLPWSDKPDNSKTEADKLVKGGREIAGYALDRQGYGKSPRESEADGPDWVKELPRRQREAGVILFRKPYEQEVLLLFLIGETPTVGIYKTAFTNALKQIDALCAAGGGDLCNRVPVLAPTFSGSVDSLNNTIRQWNERENKYPNWGFDIVTGSATAVDRVKFLKGIETNTKFSAAIAPDAAALVCVLKALHVKPADKIAILSEAGTGYGAQIAEESRRQNGKPPSDNPCPRPPGLSITLLSYPVHISQLRKAAEKVKGSDKEAVKEAPRIRPRNLRLSLEEGDDPKDIVPPFSKFETFSTELVLSNILATISNERIRYVGLSSTDIRDQIFLANEIRKHAPNVVLFTLGADLIYLHSDINLDFQGMLVASTYPLFAKNQLWTYPFAGNQYRLQFADHTSQGTYNATLALLGLRPEMLEYGDPFPQKETRDKPGIWISAVGKDDLWPVDYFAMPDDGYLYSAEGPVLPTPRVEWKHAVYYSYRIVYLLALLAGLSLAASAFLIADSWPRLSRSRAVGYFRSRAAWLWRSFGDLRFEDFELERQGYLFAFSVSLLTLAIILARLSARLLVRVPTDALCTAGFFFRDPFTWILIVPAAAATVSVGRKTFGRAAERLKVEDEHRVSRTMFFLFTITAPVCILVLALFFARDICRSGAVGQLFLNLRMLNIGSGLSLLLPLFFVGSSVVLFFVWSFRRLRGLEEFGAPGSRPFLAFGANSFVGVDKEEANVRKVLSCSVFRLPMAVLVLLLVGAPCGFIFLRRLVPSIEVGSFYVFFGVTFFLAYLAIALACVRFVSLWRAARSLLRRFAYHPIETSFRTLSKERLGATRLTFSGAFKPFSGLDFSVKQAATLVKLATRAGAQIPGLDPTAGEAEQALQRALKSEARGEWQESLILRREAHGALSRLCQILAGILEPYWTLSEPRSRWNPTNPAHKELIEHAEHFLAMRVVTFLFHIFFHLKNLLGFVFIGLLLMLLAVTSYPFQPREWILWLNWTLILAAVFVTIIFFIQMNRNSILSHLTQTTPGRLDWNGEFITRLLVYGAAPVLALLSAQFPDTLRQIVSWLGSASGGQ